MSVICIATVLQDDDADGAVNVDVREDGSIAGFTVQCLIIDGPTGYVGQNVTVKLTAPLGEELPPYPVKNQTLVIALVNPESGGENWLALSCLPGGEARPIPKAAAGLNVAENGLDNVRLVQPPKGVGVRHYVRGAAYVIRLKGTQEDFAGEFYLEADDQKNSPDGNNGSFIRMVRVPDDMATASGQPELKGKYCIKIGDAAGAFVQILNGVVKLSSPDGNNFIEVSNDGLVFKGKAVSALADNQVSIDGNIVALGYGPLGIPPVPTVDNAIRGVMAPAAGTLPQNISLKVFIAG